jgi:uncharacterized membrane protein
MRRPLLTLLGYILFLFGCISVILGFIGLSFTPLAFLDRLNPLASFLLKFSLILIGFILFYMSRVSREEEE